jgi:steroid delta-isomerase-like uncharacterized protein
MTRSEIALLFAGREQGYRQRDPATLAASHAADGVVVSPVFGRVQGREAIEQSYRDLFKRFADWTVFSEELIIDADRAAQVFRVTATHTSDLFGLKATGRRIEIHGVLFFQLQNGRIQHERRIYDFTGMLVQLGVLKARTT